MIQLINSSIRKLAFHFPSAIKSSLFVNEHPKSGGTWVSQLVGGYFGLPLSRNRIPYATKSQIFHCHELNKMRVGDGKNTIILFRDGRDVIVSYYYHSFFYNDLHNHSHVDKVRAKLNFSDLRDIENNLPLFIEFLYDRRYYPKMTWADFVDSWVDSTYCLVKYESFLDDPVGQLHFIADRVGRARIPNPSVQEIVSLFAFDRQLSLRRAVDSRRDLNSRWLRSGKSGEWKKYFSGHTRRVFNQCAGKSLIRAGYESSDGWVSEKR